MQALNVGQHLCVDGDYDRLQLMDKAAFLDFMIEIIRHSDTVKEFKILLRQWGVERTFGWRSADAVL